MKEKKKILSQMFDVRPVDESGDLDLEKIGKMEKVVSLSKKTERSEERKNEHSYEFSRKTVGREIPKKAYQPEKREEIKFPPKYEYREENFSPPRSRDYGAKKTRGVKGAKRKKIGKKKTFLKWGIGLIALVVVVIFANAVIRGLAIKKNGLASAQAAMVELIAAKESFKSGDFGKASAQFAASREKLDNLSDEFQGMGNVLVEAIKYVPVLSKISSGSHMARAGGDISQAGLLVSDMLKNLDAIKSGASQGNSISYLKVFKENEETLRQIAAILSDAQDNLDSVNVDDLPENDRKQFIQMKQTLPEVTKALDAFLGEERIFDDILGGNGPRKYLFLFQNNQEMRPTGGFIGSYGLLDIFSGHVRKFFIDGIFDPDGQLRTRIEPPGPIQKISVNWSLHDSNWFPNFPTSAKKAAWFYEKAGGPTVDGVITMTPTVMQKLLALTGPIDMPDYGVTVDENNFIQEIQYEVEVDYDKELNHPKQILSDLAPKILNRILNMKNFSDMQKAANILLSSLNEKQILIYSTNPDIEKVLSENNWSGEVLSTPKDYLSVINTNINGFKTDGVIDEKISHEAEIQKDGSIIDTVTITRHHNGGDTPFEWWNKVNSDYMRVYVPEGSKLLSAEGQTREIDDPPVDYKALGYSEDADVAAEERTMQMDPGTGTRIFEDSGKTVFANWVYVSPKETATVKYTYLLPFKIQFDPTKSNVSTYSLLAQKQSGSLGSGLVSEIDYPAEYKTIWQSPADSLKRLNGLPNDEAGIKMETDLKTDKFIGIAFSR